MLTLFYGPSCPYSLGTRIVLSEKGLPFVRRVVRSGEKPPELEEISRGKIPALLDDSFGVWESSVIVEYIEDAFTKPPLCPHDARGRALVRMAMHRIDTDILQPLERFEQGGATADPAAERARLVEPFTVWEHHMGDNGHLFGMDFSLADAWLAAAFAKAIALGVPLPGHFPRLGVWHARMGLRASLRIEQLGR